MRSRSLPRLTLRVPCTADWNAMRPIESDGRARLCGACDKPVYDTPSMTRAELVRLIEKHEGRPLPCLRLHRRPDGTVVTSGCFAPVLRAGRFLWLRVGLAAVAFWSAVCASWSSIRRPAQSVIETPVRSEPEPRMLPFVVKPTEVPDALLARIVPKSRVKAFPKDKQVPEFMGGFDLD